MAYRHCYNAAGGVSRLSSASMIWNNGVLDFHAFGWGPVVVRRYLEGKQLVCEYAGGSTTHMERLCALSAYRRIPQPRGPRYTVL